MGKTEKEKYEEKIRKLEERIQELEAQSQETAQEEPVGEAVEEGAAANILETLGKSFGLSGLIESVSKMPEFQDRLAEIDEELRRRLKETPLKGSGGHRAGEISPRVGARRPVQRSVRTRAEPPPEPSRQVDVFDEDDYVLVVCEIPGCEEDNIEIELDKDKLSINAKALHRKGGTFQKELILPCVPGGGVSRSYKNGILRVTIKKEGNEEE